jgi:hypothetical protein
MLSDGKKIKVLLCGAFGYGNLGDNLLRDMAIKFFNTYFPDIEVFVDRPHPNKELIDYVDLRIIGPGGVLYDQDDSHSNYFLQYCKPPFICLGVGIQFKDQLKENGLVSYCINNADLVFHRHTQDKDIFSVNRNSHLITDFGLHFKNESSAKHSISSFPRIGLCTCGDSIQLPDTILGKVDDFISFSISDNELMYNLSKVVDCNRTTNDFHFDSYSNMYEIIDNLDLLITSRYHAGIFAKLNQHTKIAVLESDTNRFHKMKCEFQNVFNPEIFALSTNDYIDSLNLDYFDSKALELEKNQIAKVLDEYLQATF